MSRSRLARLTMLLVVAVALALVATNFVAQAARAEAPARWTPILLDTASQVRVAPKVAVGSAEDRRELDEIVALQAAGEVSAEQIAWWTAEPGPARWNEILLTAVRDAKTNPVRVSRTLAVLNAAIHDAVVAACDAKLAYRRSAPSERDSRIKELAPPDQLSSHASVDAAIAAAALTVLSAIYPDRIAAFEERADELLRVRTAAGTHTASDIAAGTRIGEAVGALAVARAAE